MQDVCLIDDVEQAVALLKPMRLELLKRMAEPRSCPELAEALGEATQKVYYHVKALEGARLVEKITERRVGGIMEGVYQAAARSYWLSPRLVGRVGGPRRSRDQMSLDYLLTLAEDLQTDVARLAQSSAEHVPSLGLSGQIELDNAQDRAAFMQDVQTFFQSMAHKYGRRSGAATTDAGPLYRLILACYPTDL